MAQLHGLPVDPPRVLPAKYDLLRSAVLPSAEPEWIGGFTFLPEGLDVPTTATATADGAMSKSDPETNPTLVTYTPFIVEEAWKRPRGSWSDTALTDLANRAFDQTLSAAIEAKFVTGSPGLSDSNATRIGTTSVLGTVAIGEIEDAFAAIGGHGTIYIAPSIAIQADQAFNEGSDGRLYTKSRGDLVVVGNTGAIGSLGGSAASTGETFVYGHLGEPEVYVSDRLITIGSSGISNTNETTIRAEVWAGVKWVPKQWAALAKPV